MPTPSSLPPESSTSPAASAAPDASLPPVQTLGYEQARDELADVVRRLEAGSATLEESLQLWERGEQLAARCQSWLDGARRRLDEAASPPQDSPPPPGSPAPPDRHSA